MSEAALYPKVQDWLEAAFPIVRRGQWQSSHRKALITANLAWIDAGPWMRPDLAFIHVHRRRFEPVPTLDLYTIEVKPPGAQTLSGLHQTLAHGRFADFVVFVADHAGASLAVEAQASRFGVGLVLYRDPADWKSYNMLVEPKRTIPDPDLRDQFLTAALTEDRSTDEVLEWLKTSSTT